MKSKRLGKSVVLLLSLFTALQPALSQAQTPPADDDFPAINRPAPRTPTPPPAPAPAPAQPSAPPVAAAPAQTPAPAAPAAPAPTAHLPSIEENARAHEAEEAAEQQRLEEIRQQTLAQTRQEIEETQRQNNRRRAEEETRQAAYDVVYREQERVRNEQERARREAEEQEAQRVDQQRAVATYGPNSRVEPSMLGSGAIGFGSASSGNAGASLGLPIAAGLVVNRGIHHVRANASTGVYSNLNLRASAQYGMDIGSPNLFAGNANSDRFQGQLQAVGVGTFTLGTGSSGTAPMNSLFAGAGVGYNLTARTRANYLRNPNHVAAPVVTGMLRPRVTADVGVGTQIPSGGQTMAGLGLGVDAQVSVPMFALNDDYYTTFELGGSVERGFNFLNSNSNLTVANSNLGVCARPRTGEQNFRGGCIGLQVGSLALGESGSINGGLMVNVDYDFGPNAQRSVASDAPRTSADRPVENHTPHPPAENAGANGAAAQ